MSEHDIAELYVKFSFYDGKWNVFTSTTGPWDNDSDLWYCLHIPVPKEIVKGVIPLKVEEVQPYTEKGSANEGSTLD